MIRDFFQFLLIVKMYHWNTKSFAKHKSTDKCFEKLLDNLDDFIETYIGRYGREIILKEKDKNVKLHILSDKKMERELKKFSKYLESINIDDSDLLNIRDDMMGIVQKTLYLFTLH